MADSSSSAPFFNASNVALLGQSAGLFYELSQMGNNMKAHNIAPTLIMDALSCGWAMVVGQERVAIVNLLPTALVLCKLLLTTTIM